MRDIHVTRDLVAAVQAGTLPNERLLAAALHHLEQRCEVCRRELEAGFTRPVPIAKLGPALLALRHRLAAEAPEVATQEARVAEWIRTLRRTPAASRADRVERARARFRGRLFAEAALAESRNAVPNKPSESLAWAKCAEVALLQSPPSRRDLPLVARALAWSANARRAMGELTVAEAGFQALRFLLQVGGVAETQALAEADRIEGTLRKDQRRFNEAEGLLLRAIDLYLALGEGVEAELTRLTLASVANLRGLPKKAVKLVWKTLPVLTRGEHPRLHLMARFNLAHYLHDAGRNRDALGVLIYDEDLYETHGTPELFLHRRWLEAKIAFAMGDPERAEPLLRDVHAELLRREVGFDVACVAIDLALLLLAQGRHAEVQELAREAVALFEAQGVHREALAALILFQEAAHEKRLTAAFLAKLAGYLPRAAADPGYRFGD